MRYHEIISEVELGGGVDASIMKPYSDVDFAPRQFDLFKNIPTLDPDFRDDQGFKAIGRIDTFTVAEDTGNKFSSGAGDRTFVLFDRGQVFGLVCLVEPTSLAGDGYHRVWPSFDEHNGYRSSTVFIDPKYSGQGLAVKLYKFLLTHVCDYILADVLQTGGGAAIWRKMLNSRQFAVLVYDSKRHVLRKRRAGKDFAQVYNSFFLMPLVTLASNVDVLINDFNNS